MPKFRSKAAGFSLIELLVVITILGLIMAMVAPNYLRYYQKTNLENTAKLLQSTLYEAFSLARSRAGHYQVVGTKDNDFIEILKCDDLSCSSTTPESTFEFLGQNTLQVQDLQVQFSAPLGNLSFPAEASTIKEIDVIVGDGTASKALKIYRDSGLIELQPW